MFRSAILRRALLVGLLISMAFAGPIQGAEVLIFFANETSPDGLEQTNYETFTEWLREIDTERSRKLAEVTLRDAEEFPAAVDAEIAVLTEAISSGELSRPAVIFTNRLGRRGRCLVVQSGQEPSEEPFDVSETGTLVLDGNPLCRAEVFASALTRVAELFPPEEHQYVLVTKSHGSTTHALTVRLQRDYREFSREELEAILDDEDIESDFTPVGITKEEYFETLATAGREQRMTFALVFIEACRGTFEPGTVSEFPENIKLLYASGDRFLQYQTVDYPQLVVVAEQQGRFSAAYDQQLSAKYLAIFRQTDSPPWFHWLWFVPAVLFGWLWLYQRSRPAQKPSSQCS